MYEFDAEWVEKLAALRARGIAPYPNGMSPTHTSTDLHARFAAVADPSVEPDADGVAVAGRVMFRNHMGKAVFLRVQDRGEAVEVGVDADGAPILKGGIIQVYVRREEVGDATFEVVKGLDIGDHFSLCRPRRCVWLGRSSRRSPTATTRSPTPSSGRGSGTSTCSSTRRRAPRFACAAASFGTFATISRRVPTSKSRRR
jgi:hypothetical protein